MAGVETQDRITPSNCASSAPPYVEKHDGSGTVYAPCTSRTVSTRAGTMKEPRKVYVEHRRSPIFPQTETRPFCTSARCIFCQNHKP
jgi:hypothetical protein